MADIVDFGGVGVGRQHTAAAPTVYTKAKWSDDWTAQPDLWPSELNWSVAPSLPTATLRWQYGWLRTPTNLEYFERLKKTGQLRLYVRIDCPTVDADFDEPETALVRKWFGIIDLEADQIGGVSYREDTENENDGIPLPVKTGLQTFTAYGIEKILADHVIGSAWFLFSNVLTGATGLGEQPVAPAFNAGGKPNRSFDPQFGAGEGGSLTSYVFEFDPTIAQYWTTKNIVEYLLHRATPRNADGEFTFRWFDILALDLPDWDRPVIEQQGQTIYSLLARLLDRRRLRLFWFEVIETGGVESAYLKMASLNAEDVQPAEKEAEPIPGNARKLAVRFQFDQGTHAAVKRAGIEKVDQVVARGRRRLSVFTVSKKDVTLETGWDPALTSDYNDGATNRSDWAELGTKERQKANAEARSVARLEDVFTLYQIPASWNYLVGDGLGGLTTTETKHAVFPHDTETRDDDERPNIVAGFLGSCYLVQRLPFLAGVDYSGDKIEKGTFDEATAGSEPQELQPFAVFRVPETAKGGAPESDWRWAKADAIGDNGGLEATEAEESARWSATVRIPDQGHAIRLKVHNAPQHIIDNETFFVPVEHETLRVDPELAAWDFNEGGLVTVAMEDPRYAEAVWPPADELPAESDYLRRKFIDGGKDFRKIYVVPETVVDVDADGKLKRSDGGFLPYAGAAGDEDDIAKLTTIAKTAFEWYGQERFVLVLESIQLKAEDNGADAVEDWLAGLALGAMVESLDQFDAITKVNTPITAMTFSYPFGSSPHMTLQTWAGELDAMQVAPLPTGMAKTKAPKGPGAIARILRLAKGPASSLEF